MSGELLLNFLLLVILLVTGIYLIRFWGKKLTRPSNRRKDIEKSLKVDKIESLLDDGKITPEEFQKIRQVIARKLNSIEDEEKAKNTDSGDTTKNPSEEKKQKG